MRAVLPLGALFLTLGAVTPASAMCGGGAGMMCGAVTPAQAQNSTPGPMTPMATPDQSKPRMAGGCPCCQNMAMMQPKRDQDMPGMEMPKQ
jgi:hypothetical protein